MSERDPTPQADSAVAQAQPGVPANGLPASPASIDGFLVGVGDSSFVIPLEQVLECLELSAQERREAGRRQLVNLRGEVLPYANLRQIFAIDECSAGGASGSVARSEIIVVVRSAGQRLGLAVDVLHGEVEAVIKPLGRVFSGVPGIGGSIILGNGQVALVLDVPGLLAYLAAGSEQNQDAA